MDEGYVRLWRKYADSPVFKNVNVCTFWCWCLTKASYKEYTAMVGYQKVDLLPGQFVFGRKKATEELPLSEQEIRTCISTLKELEILTIKSTNKYSVITLCNWASEQSNSVSTNQQTNQQATSKQPASNHIQEVKEVKEGKENREPLYVLCDEVIDYLNDRCSKKFRHSETNRKHIKARLLENFTVADCKKVIDTKLHDPYFKENRKYYNPETLFRASNFEKYLQENPKDYIAQQPEKDDSLDDLLSRLDKSL